MDDCAEDMGRSIVDAALRVHTALGPGLMESAYEACLAYELSRKGVGVCRQVPLSVEYEEIALDLGYRLDLLVGGCVIVELKAVDKLLPLHFEPNVDLFEVGQL